MATSKIQKAVLYAAKEPSEQQQERLLRFLEEKYGKTYELDWHEDVSTGNGFRLVVGDEVYDHTKEGRFLQLKELLGELALKDDAEDVISLYRSSIDSWDAETVAEEEGTVLSVGDGIVFIDGLGGAEYGEIVVFESGVKGMFQDIRQDTMGVILFGDDSEVRVGSRVRRTKKTAGIPVGDAFLGRVVNALGEPIDGMGPIAASDYRIVEAPAASIIERQNWL